MAATEDTRSAKQARAQMGTCDPAPSIVSISGPPRRCVLLFARGPGREALVKDLRPARLLFDEILRRLSGAVATLTGVDLVLIDDGTAPSLNGTALLVPQRGTTFGERFESAFKDVRALGYDEIVAVGGDIPSLGVCQIDAAFRALGERDVVLGASPDGGVYLIGSRVPVASLFRGIQWKTATVFSALLRNEPGAAVLDETIHDIDDASDLRILSADPGLDPGLRSLIRALLTPVPIKWAKESKPARDPFMVHPIALRGPPAPHPSTRAT